MMKHTPPNTPDAGLLEAEVRSRPLEWFHFSRFLGPPLPAQPEGKVPTISRS